MPPASARALLDRSILLVFLCTLIGAAAQVFMKLGAARIQNGRMLDILFNPELWIGYSLYGVSTMLLVLALRKGQLSVLYPVISLTYVWVVILSMYVFKESMNMWKALGLTVIVAGVGMLGRDSD